MNFRVVQRDLASALATVSPAMARSGADIDTHFLFRPSATSSRRAEVLTYSRAITAQASIPVTFIGDNSMSFTIAGTALKKLVASVPADALLCFDYENGATTVSLVGDSRQTVFPTLDPTTFPYTDETFAAAKYAVTISADRLRMALTCAKRFGLPNDGKYEGLAVMEFRNGVLWSTCRTLVCRIVMPGTENVSARFHCRSIDRVLAFLALATTEPVEILQHERRAFLRRGDGSYFGESRFHETFPAMKPPPEGDQITWNLLLSDVSQALKWIASSANESTLLRVVPVTSGLQLESEAEGKVIATALVSADLVKTNDPRDLPEMVFNFHHFEQFVGAIDERRFHLGVKPHRKSAFLRYTKKGRYGDDYTVLLVGSTPDEGTR